MMSSVLSQLFILLVGAILTGIIIPKINRKRQFYQKELDLKAGLLAEMSQSVMTIVMTIEFCLSSENEDVETNAEKKNLQLKLKEWQIQSCVIGSKLHAYFPGESPQEKKYLHKQWEAFSEQVVEASQKVSNKKEWLDKKDELLETKS